MNFGSLTPVLEFLHDRIEDTEAAALGNDTTTRLKESIEE